MSARRCALPTGRISCTTAPSFTAGRPMILPRTRTSNGFTWGRNFDWTNGIRWFRSGDLAKTSHQARPEAHSDAVIAAGDQAAADVNARVVGAAQPGDGREPDARGSADRRAPAGRSRTGKTGRKAPAGKGRHLGRSGLRIFLRRLPGRRVPAAHP